MTRHLSFTVFLLLFVSSFLLSLPTRTAADSDVATTGSRDLTPAEFTSVVFTKPTLVKFFAPWCGHCRALAPIWDEAASLIHRTHPNVQLVGVDCTLHGELCSKFGVHGYPTIKYIRPAESDTALLAGGGVDGSGVVRRVYVYVGQRTVLGMEQFVSQDSLWQAATVEDYPLPLPPTPIPLQLSTHEQRKQAEVAAEDGPVAEVAAVSDSVVAARGSNVGGGLMAAAVAAAGSGSGLLYGEWLNVALGVVMLLIALVGYWLYVAARGSARSTKAV